MARARLSRTLWATRMGWTRKGPISTGFARDEGPEVGGDASLLKPAPGEAQSEAAAVDRGRSRLQGKRHGSDVVLVAVSEQDPAKLPGSLGKVGEVGHDRVDAGHLGRRKENPGVQKEKVLLPLEEHRVQPELPESPERNEAQGAGVVRNDSSVSSSSLQPAFSTRHSATNSTTDSVSARRDPSRLSNLK